MGITFFKRMKNGVQLTYEGRTLMPYISSIVKSYNMMNKKIEALGGAQIGFIDIGTYSSIASSWLPTIIREFKRLYPNITIRIREGNMSEIEKWIYEKSIDLGFLSWRKEQKFKFVVLARDPLYAVVPKTLSLPEKYQENFPISAFKEYPFISYESDLDHDDIPYALKKAGVSIKKIFFCGNDYTIIRMVENNLGISLLPGMVLENHEQNIIKIPILPATVCTLGIGISPDNMLSKPADTFMKLSKQIISKMGRQ